MAQKMQMYNEMSTTKGHPWVPQESQLSTKGIPRLSVVFSYLHQMQQTKVKIKLSPLDFQVHY